MHETRRSEEATQTVQPVRQGASTKYRELFEMAIKRINDESYRDEQRLVGVL